MITVGIQSGYAVAFLPGSKEPISRVSLRSIAQWLVRRGYVPAFSAQQLAALDRLGTLRTSGDEVGWGLFKKIKRAVKKVAKVAVKVVKNKAVQQLWQSAKAATPMPYQAGLVAAEAGVRFGAAVASGLPKAKKLAPAVQAAAEGKISVAKLRKLARKARVSPRLAVEAAAAGRMFKMAKLGDKKAAAALELGKRIVDAGKGKKVADTKRTVTDLALQKKYPGARTFTVKGRNGQTFQTVVVPR